MGRGGGSKAARGGTGGGGSAAGASTAAVRTDAAARGTGGLASRINFVKPPGAGLTVVRVDVARLDASLASTPSFHVGPGGTGAAIAGRYPEVQGFLANAAATGAPVHMTRVYVDKQGNASIGDGRHRFAVLRDSGATVLPVAVPRGNAAKLRRLFGA